ncbi:MAG: hypothetical protein ACON4K_02760 [Akkermansiaceae bacterium]
MALFGLFRFASLWLFFDEWVIVSNDLMFTIGIDHRELTASPVGEAFQVLYGSRDHHRDTVDRDAHFGSTVANILCPYF